MSFISILGLFLIGLILAQTFAKDIVSCTENAILTLFHFTQIVDSIFHKFISVRTENDTIIHVPDQELEVNFSIVFALHGLGNNYPHNLQVRLRTVVWKLRKITFRFQITIQQKFREITFFTNKTLFFVFFKKYREINQLNSTKDCKLYVILLLEIRVGKIELFLRLKPRQMSRWRCKDM